MAVNTFQAKLATVGGDIWVPDDIKCVFPPWPFRPILYGIPHTESSGMDYHCFLKLLKPGDFLACYAKSFKPSNRNISATVFKHLAIYTGPITGNFDHHGHSFSKARSAGVEYKDNGHGGVFENTVTHATSDGVVVEDFFDFLHHYDKVIAVRPTTDIEKQQKIVDSALDNVGLDYNFDFSPDGPKSFYCTELGVYCLEQVGLPAPEKFSINISWKGFLPWNWFRNPYKYPVTLADDIVASFPAVCTTVSCDDGSFWKESRHSEKLRHSIQNSPDARTVFK